MVKIGTIIYLKKIKKDLKSTKRNYREAKKTN